MELENRFSIAAPVDRVWEMFTTPETLASCLPGFTLTAHEGGTVSGTLTVKLGPVSITYTGSGTSVERDVDDHKVLVVEATGRDARGSGTATATIEISLVAAGAGRTTTVTIATELAITGYPGHFGSGVYSDAADKIIGKLAACMDEKLAPSARAGVARPVQPVPSPVSGGAATGPPPDVIAGVTARMNGILQAAEDEAEGIRAKARADADQIRARAAAGNAPAGPPERDGYFPDPGWFVDRAKPRLHRYWDGEAWVGRPWEAPDSVFVSYTRQDEAAVRDIVADLRAARLSVWFDEELESGAVWWEEILRRIRDAAVFLHVLSDASLASTPCRYERGYAEGLGIPIVAVQVAHTDLRTSRYGQRQVIDYLQPTRRLSARLVADVLRSAQQRGPLPSPPPPPPQMPFGYLMRLAEELDAREISLPEQWRIFQELAGHLEVAPDQGVRDTIVGLLHTLLKRGDSANAVCTVVRSLLAKAEA